MSKIPIHIAKLLEKGECQTLDFKFEISNAQKIAKTLVAFANTEGGTLLIGVKDNGTIAGIRTNEEIYMIESAANIYSRPKIKFQVKDWFIDGKQILEIVIPKKTTTPYLAKDYDETWKPYIRKGDQNFLANNVLLRYWNEKNNEKKQVKITYSRKEELLLDYIKEYEKITIETFCLHAQITQAQAEDILVNFLILDIIEMVITDKECFYKYKNE